MTNEQVIKLLPRKKLAEMLINQHEELEWDEDYDGDAYIYGSSTWYKTSDGEDYYEDYDSALQHECWWLAQENKGGIDINNGS